jgi:hypothetical protein
MSELSESASDKNKEAAGGVACMLWIATGIYYFATTSQASFLSWQALAFFVGGAFLSALVLGAGSHYFLMLHRKFIYRRPTFGSIQPMVIVAIVSNLLLNILQFVIPIATARWTFLRLYGIA